MSTEATDTRRAITYHALRRVGALIQEIRVTRSAGGSYRDMAEEHVRFWPDNAEGERLAKRAIRKANGCQEEN